MSLSKPAHLFPVGFLALATACGPSAGGSEKMSESKTGTKVEAPVGATDVKVTAVVGTVTTFTAGKKVEVTTAEKKTLSFDLDDKGVVHSVDPAVAVGRKVTVVDETGRDNVRHVSVKPGT